LIYTDLWPLIQQDILGVLSADEFIGTRIGYAVEPGETISNINAKLTKVVGAGKDGKIGVGFLVLPIERAEDENPNMPGGPLKLTITIQFVENVNLNQSGTGAGIPIRVFAARCQKILKLYTPVGLTNSLVSETPVISEFTDDTNKALRIGQIEFTATEADDAPMRRLNRPTITVAGSDYPFAVSVTQPDSTAIYYTKDGSHPYEGNPQATLYAGPVTITEACLFRCRAFGAGDTQIASDTAAQNFV